MTEKNFQQCAHLKINDEYLKTNKPLELLFEAQKELQEKYLGYDFNKMRESLKSMKEFIDINYQADMDEWREFYNAMGGKDGSAFWKKWKSKHNKVLEKSFDNLSIDEKKEIWFELVDRLHFFINLCLLVDLKPDMLFNMYLSKRNENINRQNNGY